MKLLRSPGRRRLRYIRPAPRQPKAKPENRVAGNRHGQSVPFNLGPGGPEPSPATAMPSLPAGGHAGGTPRGAGGAGEPPGPDAFAGSADPDGREARRVRRSPTRGAGPELQRGLGTRGGLVRTRTEATVTEPIRHTRYGLYRQLHTTLDE